MLAGVLNNNVNFVTAMSNNTDPTLIANVLKNEEFLTAVIGKLNPGSIAGALNANSQMMSGLIARLNPQVIAGIVNDNVSWISQLQMAMDAAKTAESINASAGFLTTLVSKLDPAVIAKAVNANPDASSKIMKYLNVNVIAGVVNANGTFLTNLVKYLNTTVLANAMNANPTMMSDLISKLNANVIAGVVNSNGTFLTNLMNQMDPKITAHALNSTQGQAFVNGLLDQNNGIDPAVVAGAVNSNGTFLRGVIANLTPHVPALADPMNSAVGEDFSERLMRDGLDPKVVAGLLNGNGAFISSLLTHLNPQVVADAVNNNQAFLTQTMGYTNTGDVVDVLNNNAGAQTTINTLVGLLDGGVIAHAMNAHPEMTVNLLAAPPTGIDPAILGPILASPTTKDFLGPFLANMSATGTRTLLMSSGNFIGNLLNRNTSGISASTLVQAIAGPTNAGINPRTGTAWNPSQNIMRRTWMYGATEIMFGWTLPAMGGWVQIQDARVNNSAGQPLDPW